MHADMRNNNTKIKQNFIVLAYEFAANTYFTNSGLYDLHGNVEQPFL